MIDARAGEHTGETVYAWSNRTPRSATPSRCGVLQIGLP